MADAGPPWRVALLVAYDGTEFAGFQSQVNGRAVQDVLEAALADLYGTTLRVRAASRTDAGVHAVGQVASVDLGDAARYARIPLERLPLALDGRLPADVRVLAARAAGPGFDPRRAASKTYRYRLLARPAPCPLRRRFVWHVGGRLDVEAMATAAEAVIGRHDFSAFAAAGASGASRVREVRALRVRAAADDEVHVDVEADGFLYRMVRNLVGTLVEIGRGRRAASDMASILASRRRALAGATAPPQGLCLMEVRYADDPGAAWVRAPAASSR
jgi:tRNA pseudouridine38-40 synthase